MYIYIINIYIYIHVYIYVILMFLETRHIKKMTERLINLIFHSLFTM